MRQRPARKRGSSGLAAIRTDTEVVMAGRIPILLLALVGLALGSSGAMAQPRGGGGWHGDGGGGWHGDGGHGGNWHGGNWHGGWYGGWYGPSVGFYLGGPY